jgi:hypothetical protein
VRCGVNPSRLSSNFSPRQGHRQPSDLRFERRQFDNPAAGLHSGAKFLRLDGLGYIVIRARSQSGDNVSSAVSCREQNHVNARSSPAGS